MLGVILIKLEKNPITTQSADFDYRAVVLDTDGEVQGFGKTPHYALLDLAESLIGWEHGKD